MFLKQFSSIVWKFIFYYLINYSMVDALLSTPRIKWEIAKYEYCTVMKFLILEEQSVNNFHERLTNVYGDIAPLYATIIRWVAEFQRGRTSLEDDHHAGRPVEVTTDDCSFIHSFILYLLK